MKNKILIIIGIIVVLLVGVFAYFIVSDLMEEDKLQNEINEVLYLTNEETLDEKALYEKLETTVTKGDYAKVEEAIKLYIKDQTDVVVQILDILEDDTITKLLSAENYKGDGPLFENTENYIVNTKIALTNLKNEYTSFYEQEKILSYINKYNLDSYYIDLYTKITNANKINTDTTIEDSIDDVIELLDNIEKTILFLKQNNTSWQVIDQNISFENDELLNEYNRLLANIG